MLRLQNIERQRAVRMWVRVRVRVRMGGGMRYLRTEKLRPFHLRPFIVLTITGLGSGLGISVKEVTGCDPFHM